MAIHWLYTSVASATLDPLPLLLIYLLWRCILGHLPMYLCILTFMPGISWSQFSMWLCQSSQSAVYSSGPGLYRICTLCWCICSMMCCSCCENVTTSLLIMVTSALWSVLTHTGGSCLSWIFWEHENQSGLLVIWLIYIKLYRKKETKFWKKKSGLSGNLA